MSNNKWIYFNDSDEPIDPEQYWEEAIADLRNLLETFEENNEVVGSTDRLSTLNH